jgi:hypothetical protein
MVALICLSFLLFSCQKDDNEKPASKINYHFATLAEGQQLLAANNEYYNSLNQNNIDWRMRKTGAALGELRTFAPSCVRDFNEEEKAAVTPIMCLLQRNAWPTTSDLPSSMALTDRITKPRSSSPISTMPCATTNRETDNT